MKMEMMSSLSTKKERLTMPGTGPSTMSYQDTLIHMREQEIEALRDAAKEQARTIAHLVSVNDEHETTNFRLVSLLKRNDIEYKDSLL